MVVIHFAFVLFVCRRLCVEAALALQYSRKFLGVLT
jgi:hypothetical protein